jgi:hypothetical protein
MDWVTGWLDQGFHREAQIPPLCMELVLADGREFYLQTVFDADVHTETVCLGVWDMRAMDGNDIGALKARLNEIDGRTARAEDLHPKLDRAILRLRRSDIRYCVEWHDRFWPEDAGKPMGFKPMGFRAS